MKLRVVKLNNYSFAVGKFNIFGCAGFLDAKNDDHFWNQQEYILKWATFESFWQAEDRMKSYKPKPKRLAICKVFV